MRKTYEEKLWDWLIKNFPEKTDARRIFDYVYRLNKLPRRIEFSCGLQKFSFSVARYSKHFPVKKKLLTNDTKPLRIGVKKP